MTPSVQKLIDVATLAATVVVAAALLLVGASVLPGLFGYQSYVVRSGSMEPTISTGAVVVVRTTIPDQLQVGDIISFSNIQQRGVTVTHRLVGIDRTDGQLRLRTKGDANNGEDVGHVDVSQPVARVAYWVPFAGFLLVYVNEPGIRLGLLGVGILVLWLRSRRGTVSAGVASGSTSPEVR